VRPIDIRAFNQRRDRLYARLGRLGRLGFTDVGGDRRVRKLVADLLSPGYEVELGLPDQVRFRYQEWWRRSSLGWVRVRYDYDFFDLLHGGGRGYHLHPLIGNEPVPHAVCVLPDGAGEGVHYDAYEVDLLAAHEEFEKQYAASRPIDCGGLPVLDPLGLTFGSLPGLEAPERAEWGDR
jgi:hypothetical protein